MLQDRFSDNDKRQPVEPRTDQVSASMSVVIVNYNSREYLRNCLLSIGPEQSRQVVVVDNLSSDGSEEMVKHDFPWVQLIISEKNAGYGAAANLAIANSSSKYVLLLNPDTVLQPGALQVLFDYLDSQPRAAIVGPQLVNPDGTPQVSCFEFPTPFHTLMKETRLSRFKRRSIANLLAGILDGSIQGVPPMPWVLGAALAIRRSAFDAVGGFDQSFFMYYEEVDLCYRLHLAGWQTLYAPEAFVMHVGGASTKPYRAAMLRQFYKSLCHFYQQHYSDMQKLQLKFILTYVMIRNFLKDRYRSYRSPVKKEEARDNLSIWQSILSSIWARDGWL
jgi:N-acetylglucosaminyl-diphospho-decaprenol L-rhamnosyltransferase